MNNTQTHSRIKALVALLTAVSLYACNGEDAKPGAKETAAPAKVTETQTAPTLPESTASTPAAITQAPPPVPPAPVTPPAKPAVVPSSDKSGLINIAKGKLASQSGDYSGTSKASLAVDGNVDGSFNHGSVTHTNQNPNAWLDIDLGNKEKIDHIVVWNRTDGVSERLANYWIFVSDKPFSSTDTVEKLKKSKGIKAIKGGEAKPSFTTSGVGSGRYVRILLDGSAVPNSAYLHVAEVEVYQAK